MDLDSFSDCRSGGSSMNSSRTWGSEDMDWQAFQSQLLHPLRPRTKALSFADLVNGRCTIEDVMQEFRMNGSDAPYNPEDDHIWTRSSEVSPGSHAANSYMRQKSWPAPERSPPQRLPRPLSASFAVPTVSAAATFNEEISAGLRAVNSSRMSSSFAMPATPAAFNEGNIQECERWADPRALAEAFVNKPSSLPQECRFCKNNGERISYYRSHVLRDAAGRVACPVLRALVCPRCGARGDDAHTLKYCPRSTSEERTKSAAMMRSVRMASGRRRVPGGANVGGVGTWGANASGVGAWGAGSAHLEPLSPLWTALEQKLMLSLS